MRQIATFLLTLGGSFGAVSGAQDPCPFAAMTTRDVGQGTGWILPTVLELELDPATCGLEVTIQAFSCCNTYFTRHFVAIGASLLPQPIPLRGKFMSGSLLYVSPDLVRGPFPGGTSRIQIPPDPSFLGRTFAAQAAPTPTDMVLAKIGADPMNPASRSTKCWLPPFPSAQPVARP